MTVDRAYLIELERTLAHEQAPDPRPLLALLVADRVTIPPEERRAAIRRAMLLLAAGGDPHRELDANGRAVVAFADELDQPGRRGELVAALREVAAEAGELRRVQAAADALAARCDEAWRMLALALLAEEIADA